MCHILRPCKVRNLRVVLCCIVCRETATNAKHRNHQQSLCSTENENTVTIGFITVLKYSSLLCIIAPHIFGRNQPLCHIFLITKRLMVTEEMKDQK